MEEDRKSSEEWQKLYPNIVVLDPDGWNRKDFENSWDELITEQEYKRRVTFSTCMFNTKEINNL